MRSSIAALSALFLFIAAFPCLCTTRTIIDFETSIDLVKWSQQPSSFDSPRLSTEFKTHGKHSLLIDNSFISERVLLHNTGLDLSNYESLIFDIYVPGDAHAFSMIFFAIDSELNWYQTYIKNAVISGEWSTIKIDLTNKTGKWRSFIHYRPWSRSVRKRVTHCGLQFIPHEKPYYGRIYIDNIRGVTKKEENVANRIYDLRVNSKTIRQYDKFEITFSLDHDCTNPFDPKELDIICSIQTPSGMQLDVPAFYYQNYKQHLVGRIEELLPVGDPMWKVRFSPTQPGAYHYFLTVKDSSASPAYKLHALSKRMRRSPLARYILGTCALTKSLSGNPKTSLTFSAIDEFTGRFLKTDELKTAVNAFKCIESDNPGFIRISDKDGRCFEFSNGEFFWPIGMNLCAAYDVRNAEILGVIVNRYEGTKAFERFITGMAAGNATFARIWMSCWSLAIEWSKKYHHQFESLGDYSMKNAWRLDRIMNMAENNNVYVQLTLDTFGHFRKHPDKNKRDKHQDWTGNAYNFMAGGILSYPWYFFIDDSAFDYYAKRLRYINSRWGYSRALMGWEICNEIDLITYPPKNFGLKRAQFDKRLVKWHKKTADLLHKNDIYGHLVTTNYASYTKDYNVWRLKELDYITTNRYVIDLPTHMGWIYLDKMLVVEKQTGIVRPHFLLESGSDFRGGSIDVTENYIHISLWASWMFPYSASGMAWWWVLIDQENFYHHFDAFSRFIEGEDRREHDWTYRQYQEFMHKSKDRSTGRPEKTPLLWGEFEPASDTVVFADSQVAEKNFLEILYLHDDTTAYVWIYDREAYGINTTTIRTKRNDGIRIRLLSLLPGKYTIEIWDTRSGEIINSDHITKSDAPLTVSLPSFEKDIAVKIKPAPSTDDEYLDD